MPMILGGGGLNRERNFFWGLNENMPMKISHGFVVT